MTTPVNYSIEALGRDHQRSEFQCGVLPLDRYIREQAGQDAKKRIAAPFVLLDLSSNKIAGYYTLSMTSIVTLDLPAELIRKLPRYDAMPAVLLGRLALDTRYQGKALGEYLLLDALTRSLQNPIAAAFVVVDAIDDQAKRFYERYGFIAFNGFEKRLFLPMKTIEGLLSYDHSS